MMPKIFAVGPTQTVHSLKGGSVLHRMREGARSFRKVIRMEECGPTKTQEIRVPHTDIVQSPLIELGLFAMGPQRPEQAGHRFDDLTKLVFAFPNSLFRLSSVIDIDQDAVPTQNRAIAC